MAEIYEGYKNKCVKDNVIFNKKLLFDLVSHSQKAEQAYNSITFSMNQYLISENIKGHSILLQATEFNNGKVEISIQGLHPFGIESFIDFSSNEDSIFMNYLKFY